ncbi:MAG: DUF3786 domain-containing protein [Eubacteriales bacterium]|nr:DUF3786 domain-containing protein [Eubacteriales bacterium]
MDDNKENRQYSEMLRAAAERIGGIDIAAKCAYAGAEYDAVKKEITVESFGVGSVISLPSCTCFPPLHIWQHLSILQYLEAVGPGESLEIWGSLADLPEGGHVRGASFDREVDGFISRRLGLHTPGEIIKAVECLGGEIREDPKADLSAVFRFMPGYPFLLNMWFSDDEFPASGKILIDRSVSMFLGTEANGTLASMLAEMLCDAADEIEDR